MLHNVEAPPLYGRMGRPHAGDGCGFLVPESYGSGIIMAVRRSFVGECTGTSKGLRGRAGFHPAMLPSAPLERWFPVWRPECAIVHSVTIKAHRAPPRCCLIPWSQGLPHTLVPGTASYPGPRYCLIPWSQLLPHTLVRATASYPGPRSCPCRVQKIKQRKMGPNWKRNGPFDL